MAFPEAAGPFSPASRRSGTPMFSPSATAARSPAASPAVRRRRSVSRRRPSRASDAPAAAAAAAAAEGSGDGIDGYHLLDQHPPNVGDEQMDHIYTEPPKAPPLPSPAAEASPAAGGAGGAATAPGTPATQSTDDGPHGGSGSSAAPDGTVAVKKRPRVKVVSTRRASTAFLLPEGEPDDAVVAHGVHARESLRSYWLPAVHRAGESPKHSMGVRTPATSPTKRDGDGDGDGEAPSESPPASSPSLPAPRSPDEENRVAAAAATAVERGDGDEEGNATKAAAAADKAEQEAAGGALPADIPKFAFEERKRGEGEAHPHYDPLLAATNDAPRSVIDRLRKQMFNYVAVRPEDLQVPDEEGADEKKKKKKKKKKRKLRKTASSASLQRGTFAGRTADGTETTTVTAQTPRTAAAAAAEREKRLAEATRKKEEEEKRAEEAATEAQAPSISASELHNAHVEARLRGKVPEMLSSAVADMIRLKAAGVEDRIVPGEAPPMWNEKWQNLVGMPVYDEVSLEKRYLGMDSLWHEFLGAVTPTCRRIVEELRVPRADQSVKHIFVPSADPSAPTDKETRQQIHDRLKYFYRGVFYQVIEDDAKLHGSAGLAAKAAAHELRATRYLSSCDLPPSIHFPLMAIVDYLGYRIVATAIVPVTSRPRRWIGSANGGRDVICDSEGGALVAEVAEVLNLKQHSTGSHSQAVLPLPGDIEGIIGADGRRYLCNLRRLFPASATVGAGTALARVVPMADDAPLRLIPMPTLPESFDESSKLAPPHIDRAVKAALGEPGMNGGALVTADGRVVFFRGGGKGTHNNRASIIGKEVIFGDACVLESYTKERPHLWCKLRPELVIAAPVPISSDVFTRLGIHNYRAHNADAIRVTERMIADELPVLAQEIEMHLHQFQRDESWTGPKTFLNKMFHRRGVNLCHMGRVRALSRSNAVREVLLAEIMARTCAWMLKRSLRTARGDRKIGLIVVAHINNIMGHLVADKIEDDEEKEGDGAAPEPIVEEEAKVLVTEGAGIAGLGSIMANVVTSAAKYTENEHHVHFKAAMWSRFEHCLSPAELGPTCNLWEAKLGHAMRTRLLQRVQALTGVRLGVHVDGTAPVVRADVFEDGVECCVKEVGPLILPQTAVRRYWRGEGSERAALQTRFERRNSLIDMAAERCRAELVFRESVLGSLSSRLAPLLIGVADLMVLQPRTYAAAEDVLKRVIKVWELAEPAEADPVALCLAHCRIANYYKSDGQLRLSEKHLLDALDVGAEELGPQHPDQASTMNDLAGLYKTAGLFEESEKLYRKCMARVRYVYGEDNTRFTTLQSNLADLYLRMDDLATAEMHLVAVKKKEKQLLGELHKDYIATLFTISKLYMTTDRYQAAETVALEIVELQEKALGETHPDCAIGLAHIAQIFQALKKYKKAEVALLEARAIQREVLTTESTPYAETMFRLGQLYEDMKQFADAEAAYAECLASLKKTVGEDHPSVARALLASANLFEAMGKESKLKAQVEADNLLRQTRELEKKAERLRGKMR